tara:strand:+ start:806 stop:1162 length:357 start_codon:yes stop_codon:yes gene_type:complete
MKQRLLNTVNWRKYLIPGTSKRVDNFLEENGDNVYQQVTDRVCHAIHLKKEKIVLIVHPNAGNAIVIVENEYQEFLEVANDWFLKKENYRMCGKIKKTTETFSQKKNKLKNNFLNELC